jgi:uncharacterized protein (DUF2141 family)
MRLLNSIVLLLLAFILLYCAKQTAPTGGPKDEEPPKVLKATPSDQEINFKGNKIELTFNEHIQLNNPREQVIITPSIGKDFEVKAKKNKVILEFKTKLKDSTTYNINFREAIGDLTEKNIAQVKLALSTGSYIDTLTISGTLKELLTDKVVKNYTVALAPQSDTFNIFTHQASWITLSDKDGNYILENLKSGTYILYAFDDKNKNLKVDSRSEKFGYISQPIILTQPLENQNIETFKLDIGPFKLISARPMFNYFNIKTSKSIVESKISSSDPNQLVLAQQDKDLSNIKIYNTLQDVDSLLISFSAVDSIQNRIDTTLYIKFNKREAQKDKFSASVESVNYFTSRSQLLTTVNFSKPVLKLNTDSLYIHLDSATTITFTNDDIQWNQLFNQLTIKKTIEDFTQAKPTEKKPEVKKGDQPKSKSYRSLIFAKGSVISAEIDSLQHTEFSIKTISPEDTGIIIINCDVKESFIVQLLDKSLKVISEVRNTTTHKFENIQPGVYTIRLILDKNNNGKWDAGDFTKKTQPEPIKFYRNSKEQTDINIKANWEVGPLLISY